MLFRSHASSAQHERGFFPRGLRLEVLMCWIFFDTSCPRNMKRTKETQKKQKIKGGKKTVSFSDVLRVMVASIRNSGFQLRRSGRACDHGRGRAVLRGLRCGPLARLRRRGRTRLRLDVQDLGSAYYVLQERNCTLLLQICGNILRNFDKICLASSDH